MSKSNRSCNTVDKLMNFAISEEIPDPVSQSLVREAIAINASFGYKCDMGFLPKLRSAQGNYMFKCLMLPLLNEVRRNQLDALYNVR